jgi:IrrE N-terminal-like domain
MADPIAAAEHVLNEVGITRVEDLSLLELIAWERGALVRSTYLTGAEARIAMAGERAIITVSTAVRDPRRRRFSVAHELGHLEMHRTESGLALCASADIDDSQSQRAYAGREQEANRFAAALLLPERFFKPLCRKKEPSLDLIAGLADTFEVSLTATALRYLQFCNEACAIVFSRDGTIKWFRGSKYFDELKVFIPVARRLDQSSLAASFFQGETVPMTRTRVYASTWFVLGRYNRDATIYEQSWSMPSQNAVLTLLWIADDIEEDDDY